MFRIPGDPRVRSRHAKDELAGSAVLAVMSDEAEHLRSQAQRCRRLAKSVANDRDAAMLQRIAREFDEAAEALEKPMPGTKP